MYKKKYLKYKIKYLNLKGGRKFINESPILIEQFIKIYNELSGTSSYDKLLSLIPFRNEINNILVGCGNFDETDYNRFKDNMYYTLYIDSSNEFNSLTFDIEKQYYMYTILINEMIGKQPLPENFIDNIHLDLMVSYFCNRNEYLDLIRSSLKPGGKFVFQYVDRGGTPYFIDDNDEITNIKREVVNPNFEYIVIDHNQCKLYLTDDNIDAFFTKNTNLSPSLGISFIKLRGFKRYTSNILGQYYIYLKKILPEFLVELKTFNYQNYTYPVPLKINLDNSIQIWNRNYSNFLINNVMTTEERQVYINSSSISSDKIYELLDRTNQPDNLEKYDNFKKHIEEDRHEKFDLYTKENLTTKVFEELLEEIPYFEITKL